VITVAASTELFGAAKYDLPRDGEDGAIASAFEHFMRGKFTNDMHFACVVNGLF